MNKLGLYFPFSDSVYSSTCLFAKLYCYLKIKTPTHPQKCSLHEINIYFHGSLSCIYPHFSVPNVIGFATNIKILCT